MAKLDIITEKKTERQRQVSFASAVPSEDELRLTHTLNDQYSKGACLSRYCLCVIENVAD